MMKPPSGGFTHSAPRGYRTSRQRRWFKTSRRRTASRPSGPTRWSRPMKRLGACGREGCPKPIQAPLDVEVSEGAETHQPHMMPVMRRSAECPFTPSVRAVTHGGSHQRDDSGSGSGAIRTGRQLPGAAFRSVFPRPRKFTGSTIPPTWGVPQRYLARGYHRPLRRRRRSRCACLQHWPSRLRCRRQARHEHPSRSPPKPTSAVSYRHRHSG